MTIARFSSLITLARRLTTLLLGLLVLVLLLMILTLQTSPSVPVTRTIDDVDIRTIEQLIVDNAPEEISSAGERSLQLDKEELNLLAAFGLQTIPGLQDMAADVALTSGSASIDLVVPWQLPGLPLYLNLQVSVRQRDGTIELYGVRAGHLPIPTAVVHSAILIGQRILTANYVNYQEFTALQKSVRDVTFEEEAVHVTLDWQPDMLSQVKAQAEQLFLSADDNDRILRYYTQIAEIVTALPADTSSISLNDLLFPLFRIASVRTASGGDAIAENRNLLQALSLYVNESDVPQLTAELGATPVRRVEVTIQRRVDLAQHLTTSAAITASAGAGVAGILSNSKETYDARYRSGFSFSDLTANSAGVALGNAATSNATEALILQQRLTHATLETDYMPPVARDLAGLNEADFSEQYRDRNSQAYLERVAAIDKEIAALPVYSPALSPTNSPAPTGIQ
ncbi:MAG: hypothetical protein Q7U82_00455 [Gammaproteobacteria bacterium]|nr:hypothetical protein [Gammaproteobacteria bacterium]